MVNNCRLCGSDKLSLFLDLGSTPPADRFIRSDQLDSEEKSYLLQVVKCEGCDFVQLNYVVPPEILYQEDYPYESSTTKAGCLHFGSFANSICNNFSIVSDDLVIDIGSNVGVLLEGFKKRGCRVLGIEPAKNIAEIALKNGIRTISCFFSKETALETAKNFGKAKIITATNVFAHIDNLNDVMLGIDSLLEEDGVFIVEAPYLLHLLNNLEYDTIYHEHLSYLSVTPLVRFLEKYGFELFDISQLDIHGGSNRLFIGRKGQKQISKMVHELVDKEKTKNIHSMDNLLDFASRVRQNKEDLVSLLKNLKSEGKKIAAVSAPAKGMTLLNYCGIDGSILEFVTEKSALKIGKFTPGGHLPVKPDSALLDEKIDYALLLAWNFKDEIMGNLEQYASEGGKFIIPIPSPVIV
jgi:C-methyltransferase C-terminal domain/Putative zinc binding domain/Methyltransferase domain